MTAFFYWSGFISWLAVGGVGIFLGLDWAIERCVESFWTKRQFLAFVWDRLKNAGDKS